MIVSDSVKVLTTMYNGGVKDFSLAYHMESYEGFYNKSSKNAAITLGELGEYLVTELEHRDARVPVQIKRLKNSVRDNCLVSVNGLLTTLIEVDYEYPEIMSHD